MHDTSTTLIDRITLAASDTIGQLRLAVDACSRGAEEVAVVGPDVRIGGQGIDQLFRAVENLLERAIADVESLSRDASALYESTDPGSPPTPLQLVAADVDDHKQPVSVLELAKLDLADRVIAAVDGMRRRASVTAAPAAAARRVAGSRR